MYICRTGVQGPNLAAPLTRKTVSGERLFFQIKIEEYNFTYALLKNLCFIFLLQVYSVLELRSVRPASYYNICHLHQNLRIY